jgi:putative membrane protein
MRVERFFDAESQARVAAAVKAAEARTSGQIVPVVVARSRNYHPFLMSLGVLALALMGQLGLALLDPGHLGLSSPELFLEMLLMVALAGVPQISRQVVRRQFELAVRERAMVAFLQHGVHQTHEQNGVLVFASLYERQVVVLGDRAVHAKLGEEHWKRAVASLVASLRAGAPAEGFCRAIADIGDELAKAFPPTGVAHPNEIPDELRFDR